MITHQDISDKLLQFKTDKIVDKKVKMSLMEQWLISRGLKTLSIEQILAELPKYREF